MLDTPPDGAGFLQSCAGDTVDLRFVQPGSVPSAEYPSLASFHSTGDSIAAVDGRLFHGEGLVPNQSSGTGSAMIAVRDFEGRRCDGLGRANAGRFLEANTSRGYALTHRGIFTWPARTETRSSLHRMSYSSRPRPLTMQPGTCS